MGDVVRADSHYVEDAAKFVGIVAIVAYQVILAVDVTRGRWREAPAA